MFPKRVVPGSLIGANDAARMIIRSSLIAAPSDMRKQYEFFVSPISMGTSDYGIEGNISPEVREIFRDLVEEFKKLQFQDNKQPTLAEIKAQRDTVVATAKRYIEKLSQCTKKGAKTIGEQLAVITENISTRTVVINYPDPEKQQSVFGTFEGTAVSRRKYSDFTMDELPGPKFDDDTDSESESESDPTKKRENKI